MKNNSKILIGAFALLLMGLIAGSCQKMDRPKLGDYPLDPPPPAYSPLKSYWAMDGNLGDSGQYRLSASGINVSYITGVDGEAAEIGDGGSIYVSSFDDSLKTPGSLSVAFWIKGAPGPVSGGAQGVISFGNSKSLWGHFDIMLENYTDNDDPNAVFFKLHFVNTNPDIPTDKQEQWVAGTEGQIKDVLGKWTHIAVVYDASSSEVTLYKDGEPTAVDAIKLNGGSYGNLMFGNLKGVKLGSFSFMGDPNLSGDSPQTWAKSFAGALDNVRIYNTPLSASEVKNLFDNKE